jgi:SAM-dependent methyltransferase
VPGPPRSGDEAAECPICGHRAAAFLDYGVKRPLPDRRCPRCGSLERHRALWLHLRDLGVFDRPTRMLHVAPEPFFAERLRRHPSIDYLSGDLASPTAMVRLDITAIDAPDGSFDLVYAGHVLEHVPDDVGAMAEVHRVLRPGGTALLPVPMWGETTREDPGVTDPAERERRFGQADHVRMYGHDGVLEDRLRSVGFAVEVVDPTRDLPAAEVRRHRLAGADLIPVATRSDQAPDGI